MNQQRVNELALSMPDEYPTGFAEYVAKREWCGMHNLPRTLGPDPYYEELYGDSSDVLMCDECRDESAMDI